MYSRIISLLSESNKLVSGMLQEIVDETAIQNHVKKASEKVQIKLAKSQEHPAHIAPHIFSALHGEGYMSVAHAMAENPTVGPDILTKMYMIKDVGLRDKIKKHPKAPKNIDDIVFPKTKRKVQVLKEV